MTVSRAYYSSVAMRSLLLIALQVSLNRVNAFSLTQSPLTTKNLPETRRRLATPLHVAADVSTTESAASTSSFANFDYTTHWYPVTWAQDLKLNHPTQVTVFDVNFVVAKIPDGDSGEETVVCMKDRCPHKSAFLSEGRITSNGHFQCAYHGWTFDGTDGTCVEIPQIVDKKGDMPAISARACGTAVPAMIVQGMVWLFPGGNLEKALQAPPPPEVPEMDMKGFRPVTVVRDFPIDYSILLENILDPDHVSICKTASMLFVAFDWFKQTPLAVTALLHHVSTHTSLLRCSLFCRVSLLMEFLGLICIRHPRRIHRVLKKTFPMMERAGKSHLA